MEGKLSATSGLRYKLGGITVLVRARKSRKAETAFAVLSWK